MRRLPFIVSRLPFIVICIWLGIAPASADMTVLTYNTQFCPSWAEAHERSLAISNHGRPPYPVKWKGCIVVARGTCIDVVDHDDWSTEIVIDGKHWFTDEIPEVIAGQNCHSGRAEREPESLSTSGQRARSR